MVILYHRLTLTTTPGISIHNLTNPIQGLLANTGIDQGQVCVFSRHTTTAITVNEDEERLWKDIQHYLLKLAPTGDRYLHNDLDRRIVPPDEPKNAHAHLMAMTLGNSEVVPIVDGRLAMGTYQAILFADFDGPRDRQITVQFMGQARPEEGEHLLF